MSSWIGKRVNFRTDITSWGTGVVQSENVANETVVVLDEETGLPWKGWTDHIELADDDEE